MALFTALVAVVPPSALIGTIIIVTLSVLLVVAAVVATLHPDRERRVDAHRVLTALLEAARPKRRR